MSRADLPLEREKPPSQGPETGLAVMVARITYSLTPSGENSDTFSLSTSDGGGVACLAAAPPPPGAGSRLTEAPAIWSVKNHQAQL